MQTVPKCRQRSKELVLSMAGAVQSQLKVATSAFVQRDEKLARQVIEKDDYVDNLYTYTESELFDLIHTCNDPERIKVIRSAQKMAKGLEKIADNAENIAKQSLHLDTDSDLKLTLDINHCFEQAKQGIDLAVEAFLVRDIDLAKRAAKKEAVLDEVYRTLLRQALELLAKPGQNVKFVMTQVFAAKYLEKIGDTILDMAEETLALISGQRLKLHQVIHLDRLLKQNNLEEISMEGMWGSRSGATIFRLESTGSENVIFKDGTSRKIKEEIDKLEEWERIEPGLVPELKTTFEAKDRQIAITSFIEGLTLQEIYVKFWWSEKEMVSLKLIEILRRIYTKTLERRRFPFTCVDQVFSRLDSVYSMHGRLSMVRRRPSEFCGIHHDGLNDLLMRVDKHADKLRAPFSVFIHGDLNTDNIIFQPEQDRLQFIDVHRSGPGDYLQDISVFMVSNLRMPSISGLQRAEAERVNALIEDFAREIAEKYGDELFDERLAIYLARSLITSTRFVGSEKQARRMFLLGIEKLEWALDRLEG